jgi:serine/threonine-protein kinase RsbW
LIELMARVSGSRSKTFPATLGSVSEASAWLGAEIAVLGLTTDTAFAMALCLEEAFANLVMHGSAMTATASLACEPDVVRLEIIDDGLAFDPTQAPVNRIHGPLVDSEIGGLGIGLLHHFCRRMTYRRDADTNRLVVEFARTPG